MKKVLLALVIALLGFTANSQSINGVDLKDIDQTYVQIVGTTGMMSSKVKIEIDFGQRNKYFSSSKDTRLVGKDGKNLKFNSMIDALNFMNENGYEFLSANAFAKGNQMVYHFMLQKIK